MRKKEYSGNRSKRTSNEYVYAAPSAIHQTGLFARAAIPADADIVEYDGPRVSREEGEKMADEGNVYVFLFDRKTCIDGSVGWNLARFANHSCAPNCKSVKVSGGIWLRTLRAIAKGEELTYDYGYSFKDYENNPCRCGAENCAGYIVPERYRDRIREDR